VRVRPGQSGGRSSLSRTVVDRPVVCVVAARLRPNDREGISMSDPTSSGAENTVPSKKKTSSARNGIGLVVLLALLVVGWFQYSAVLGYNAATKALDARTVDEEQGLLGMQEAENLLGKSPDGPGSDFQEGHRTFTMTKYTWWAPFKSFTLTAFYTKEKDPHLHHFKTDGAELPPEPPPVPVTADVSHPPVAKGGEPTAAPSKRESHKAQAATKAGEPSAPPSKPPTTAASEPAKAAEPSDAASKSATTAPPEPAKEPK
jgi:hypothetical protein